ncbi:MAG: peptidase, partial [Proteobacteria bacterium]|nr:peptidase [Pseudomonadota bacterium]
VSMNPWGFLEGGDDPVPARVAGALLRYAEVQAALGQAAAHAPAAARLKLAPFAGRAFVMAGDTRLDADGRPAPLRPADLAAAGQRLGPVASQGLLAREDTYYFAHHEPVTLPAWRVLLADGRRAYLDPRSGVVLASFDADAERYRWLHQGLHRLDFVPGFRRGPAWAAASLFLLALATLGVATGAWLGLRRIGHDFAQVRRRLLH